MFRLGFIPQISHYVYINIQKSKTLLVPSISKKGHSTCSDKKMPRAGEAFSPKLYHVSYSWFLCRQIYDRMTDKFSSLCFICV